MIHIIFGCGEIGKCIGEFIEERLFHDPPKNIFSQKNKADVLHVCIPYSKWFVRNVNLGIKRFKAKITIIHSTVKVGTCDKINGDVVYSPVRGRHPNLVKDVTRFIKYYSGNSEEGEKVFRDTFGKVLVIKRMSDMRSLEFAKMADTTYYGVNLAFMRFVKNTCDKLGLNFEEVYKEYGETYNKAMEENYRRPIYKFIEGPIGGHCVIENMELLPEEMKEVKRMVDKGNKLFSKKKKKTGMVEIGKINCVDCGAEVKHKIRGHEIIVEECERCRKC